MTILIIGDANADLSAGLSRYPAEGDDSAVNSFSWGAGGSATNTAAALAMLGSSARLLARVGRDPYADVALGIARGSGVDLDFVQVDQQVATGLCFAAISPDGERTFFSFRGANVSLTIPDDAALLEGVTWLHIGGHALLEGAQRETTRFLIDEALSREVPVSIDLCLPLIERHRGEVLDLLPALTALFTNEPELTALTYREPLAIDEEPEESDGPADDDMHGLAVLDAADLPAIVAAKLGASGCLLASGGTKQRIPAFPITAIDTNGCGDAFVAGFLHAYLRGLPAHRSALLANAAGALAATRHGAAEALARREQLAAFLTRHDIAPEEFGLA